MLDKCCMCDGILSMMHIFSECHKRDRQLQTAEYPCVRGLFLHTADRQEFHKAEILKVFRCPGCSCTLVKLPDKHHKSWSSEECRAV